jgi:iron-sulfur cluster repair protein YtfE (RIC family)
MDAVTLLKKQHREVEGLFKKIEKTEDGDGRRELMEAIKMRLEMHTKLEEEIFYPAVREVESKKAEEMINEAYEEHGVVKLVLEQLPSVDPEDERFEAKMTVLKELVEHHVEEEEKEMFKLAQKLGKDQLRELGERMAAQLPEEERPAERSRGRRRAA